MALRQHLGDRGLALWDQWSVTSTKYDAADPRKRWRSFNRGDITIGSFYHLAG